MKPKVLTIAGSDNSGGAGIQGDLKTLRDFNVHGLSAITALTAQNSHGVSHCWPMQEDMVYRQIMSLWEDMDIHAVKIGLIPDEKVLRAVVKALQRILKGVNPPAVILDPVLVSSSGFSFISDRHLGEYIETLIPLTSLITPNVPEAERLCLESSAPMDDRQDKARFIHSMGAQAVILKGGHLEGEWAEDLLFDGESIQSLRSPKTIGGEVHGTGCHFSSAIAAGLAHGLDLEKAFQGAKDHICKEIEISSPPSRNPVGAMRYIL